MSEHLDWKESRPGSWWAHTSTGHDFSIDVYHHGTEVYVVCSNPNGEAILGQEVPSVKEGMALCDRLWGDIQPPDANCVTQENADCVSEQPCMQAAGGEK